jgi:hypothetical protein
LWSAAILALALVGFSAGAIGGEIADEFQERAEKKVAELRETAARSGRPLRLYPDDVRHAILEVCRDPALIVRLADAEGSGPDRLNAIVKDDPEEIQDAARKLADEHEVLTILTENLVMAGILGALYEDDPKGIKRLLDERAEKAEKAEKEVLSDWQKRLEDDPEAMKQMEAATKAYQEEVAASSGEAGTTVTTEGERDNVTVNNASGTTTTASGTTVVYAVPSYSYTVYVTNHCDWYWHLCGHMHYHSYHWASYYDDYWDDYWDNRHAAREDWQRYRDDVREDRQELRDERREGLEERREGGEGRREERRERLGEGDGLDQPGNGGMNEAMKDWKEKNGDALPKDFFKDDGKMAERFKNFGESDRAFREGVTSGEYKRGDRQKVLKNSLSEGGLQRAGERQARSGEGRPRAGSERPAGLERHTGIDRPERRPQAGREGLGKAPSTPSRTRDRSTSPSRTRVERGTLSRNQRMDRARGAHRSSWGSHSRAGGYSRGGSTRGGGGRRGGGRRGGGGRR